MTENVYPKVFISYAHEDKDVAREIADSLAEDGTNLRFDEWEIYEGDSLVEQIFEKGLKDCAVFVILLSPKSVSSDWVRAELDIAIVNRIRKVTQLVPMIIEDCEIPTSLRALRWLQLKNGLDNVVEEIVDTAYKRDLDKPNIHPPPIRSGLTTEATTVGAAMAEELSDSGSSFATFDGQRLKDRLKMTPEEINDAIEELEAHGFVKKSRVIGIRPFNFAYVEPTYVLVYEFAYYYGAGFDPDKDVKQVAAAVVSLGSASGQDLVEKLELPPPRINFAVSYLGDYGITKVYRALGTAPFDFLRVEEIGATRRFVRDFEDRTLLGVK